MKCFFLDKLRHFFLGFLASARLADVKNNLQIADSQKKPIAVEKITAANLATVAHKLTSFLKN